MTDGVVQVDDNSRNDGPDDEEQEKSNEDDQDDFHPIEDDEENSENEGGGNRQRTRKRKRQPMKWKKNVAKEKLNRGEEHVNVKGLRRPARKMDEPCDHSCKKKCTPIICQEVRQGIFDEFWKG